MKQILLLISIIVGVVLFVVLFLSVGWQEIILNLARLSPLEFLIIFSITFLTFFISIIRWSKILETQGYLVPKTELMVAKLAEMSVSFLTPILYVGGEGVRGYVLKKTSRVPLTKGLASILIDRIIEMGSAFIFFLFASVYLISRRSPLSWVMAIILLLVILGLLIFIFFYIKIFSISKFLKIISKIFRLEKLKIEAVDKEKSVDKKLMEFKNLTLGFFWNFPRVFITNILLTLLTIFLVILQYKLILTFLAYDISWDNAIGLRVLTSVLGIVPIPAALGAYEGGIILALKSIGLSGSIAITFALIIRGTQVIMVALGLVSLFQFAFSLIPKLLRGNNNLPPSRSTKEDIENQL